MRSMRGSAVIAGLMLLALAGTPANGQEYTTDFRLEDCTFSPNGANLFFSLEPGHRLLLEGEDDGEELSVEIEVLDRTRWIEFRTPAGKRLRVNTRVVRETESVDGELAEISHNFFARCQQTNDVFYFGEKVDIYEDGEIVSHGGAWLAGVGGALPGLIMPGRFLLGSRYFQEMAPGVALDRGEHTAMGLMVHVPAGVFKGCVQVLDTNALDPGGSGDNKVYCPGIGLVIDEDVELVEYDLGN